MALKEGSPLGLFEMVSVGRILRAERERQGLPLSAVSSRTKIRTTILEAIERDDIANIPSAFLYRSFVRQVASLLAVDFTQIADLVGSVEERFPTVLVPGEDRRPTRLRPIEPPREQASTWIPPVFTLIAVLAICSGLYAYLQRIHFPGAAPVVEPPKLGIKPAVSQPILLRIAAVETTWLSMDSDGHHVFTGLLKPADTKELEGTDSARLRTGNAGGLTVTFNGRELGRLGQRGQVRTVLFTRDEYEILQPTLSSRLPLILPAAALSQWMR
jgi:cytoskeleton protein RodZ